MIRGVVNARREAIVALRVRGPNGAEAEVDGVVDSGFTASLALPAVAVTALGLARHASGGAVLADGSVREFDIYAADVAWTGGWRRVLVYAVGDEVLLGMSLLGDHKLRIAVVPGGVVEIAPLPAE